MNPFSKVTFVFILVLLHFEVLGQLNFHAYKKFNYTWEHPSPEKISVDPIFKNEDVVILDDQHLVSIGGSLGSTTNIIFQRKARLKYLTAKGVAEHSSIIIPESLDPLYDNHSLPFKNNAIKKGPAYFDLTLSWFAARIIKQDGQIIPVEMTDQFSEEEVLNLIVKQSVTYKYVKSHYWDLAVKNLEPGDELEYDYQISIPFNENFIYTNSMRLFLNSELACQNYSLVFKYKTGPSHVLTFINNAEPDSINIIDKVKIHYWTRKNLFGSMDEAQSRPYLSLPYILYSLETERIGFRYNDEITAKIKFIPYWLYILRFREDFDYLMRRNAINEVKDKQNLLIDKFIASNTENIPDSLNYNKFSKVIEIVADSFKYENDEALFHEDENRAERMGEFTAGYKIREISRQKLYAKILNKLKLDYKTLYLMDNRYGQINDFYQSPIWNAECVYAVYVNKSFALAHPKKSDFGWYVDEIPFYWENTSGLMVNYDNMFYILIDKPIIYPTAVSSLNDNIRMSNVMAEVDLEKQSVVFNAKVNLTGQYSTMTRMLYTLNIKDTINNPLYNKKISDINGPVQLISQEVTGRIKTFPFKYDIKSTFKNDSLISKNSDGTSSIHLDGWFNHIINYEIDTINRQLDFYPDFVSQDTYRYYLKFSKPVTIVSAPTKVDYKNALGNLTINYSQPQPDAILIESYFVTAAEKVSPGKISDIATIFNAITELNHGEIQIKY